MHFDHVGLPSNNIVESIGWYQARFNATVLYQDDTLALLDIGGEKLTLVSPQQHPPHVAFRVTEQQLADVAMQSGVSIMAHRDGTRGLYLHDPFGNAVEIICYPPGHTLYDRP
jgi:catechol-2,3-dioxygenase